MAKSSISKSSKPIIKKPKNLKKSNKNGIFKVISTWDHGLKANQYALKVLKKGGSALEAVVAGCTITETDNG
jgi:N4-(beta-N-acetylglucosaminyl)-L-asparaginase